MNKLIRYISIVISVSIICASLSGFTASEGNVENETAEVTRDKKILCNATIDQDFDDSSILVIMDNVTEGINKYKKSHSQ